METRTSCKEKSHLEFKAFELITEINEKMMAGTEPVTIQHFNTGVFTWDLAHQGDFQ